MSGPCAVCGGPADHICSGCRVVNYCGRDHQKQHWRAHKPGCKPSFRLETSERLGRHLVAVRDIAEGEVVLQEAPLVLGPKAYSAPLCLGCHAPCSPTSYHECDGCGYPLCSPQCQVSDAHFDECQLMMSKKFRAQIEMKDASHKDISYIPVVPLRCILLKTKNPERFKKMMDLQSHLEERRATPLFALYRTNVVGFLRDRLGMQDVEEDDILSIAGVLDTNAFEVRGRNAALPGRSAALRGLYHTAAMMAHDCSPNTRHTFHGKDSVLVVSATRPIQRGAPITATYTQTLWNTGARRDHLLRTKCFSCTCRRCSDPTELGTFLGAIRCTRCVTADNFRSGPYIVASEPLNSAGPWACLNCGHTVPAKLVRSGNEDLKQEVLRLDKSPAGLEAFLDKYGAHSAGVLHPRNTHVVQVKYALVFLYGHCPGFHLSELSDEVLEKKIDYCHELLELADVLDPGHSRLRGQLLNELQAAMVVQAKRQFNGDRITKDAAQKTLADALVILQEVIDILQIEPEIEEVKQQLSDLGQELSD